MKAKATENLETIEARDKQVEDPKPATIAEYQEGSGPKGEMTRVYAEGEPKPAEGSSMTTPLADQ